MSDTRIGPKFIEYAGHLSCFGCQYYDRHMKRSGRNPIYESYCQHPEWQNPPVPLDSRGRFIGDNERETPQWCPAK